MEDDRLHCSVEVPYLLYVPVVCLVVGKFIIIPSSS